MIQCIDNWTVRRREGQWAERDQYLDVQWWDRSGLEKSWSLSHRETADCVVGVYLCPGDPAEVWQRTYAWQMQTAETGISSSELNESDRLVFTEVTSSWFRRSLLDTLSQKVLSQVATVFSIELLGSSRIVLQEKRDREERRAGNLPNYVPTYLGS